MMAAAPFVPSVGLSGPSDNITKITLVDTDGIKTKGGATISKTNQILTYSVSAESSASIATLTSDNRKEANQLIAQTPLKSRLGD